MLREAVWHSFKSTIQKDLNIKELCILILTVPIFVLVKETGASEKPFTSVTRGSEFKSQLSLWSILVTDLVIVFLIIWSMTSCIIG